MGNALPVRDLPRAAAVHPHVHGERVSLGGDLVEVGGSSPRAWGTHPPRGEGFYLYRFIPTCMGNASAPPPIFRKIAVHPHVHGERKLLPTEGLIRVGSSPRAWGTRRAVRKHPEHVRFIPTCMGNASARMHRVCSSTVHPHVHGERVKSERDTERFFGSSPRAWGTPNTPKSTSPGRRFIPTCMGNAFRWNLRSESPAVHPHVHGERNPTNAPIPIRFGSSPRAWGTRNGLFKQQEHRRFIPTCMGNARAG